MAIEVLGKRVLIILSAYLDLKSSYLASEKESIQKKKVSFRYFLWQPHIKPGLMGTKKAHQYINIFKLVCKFAS